ncbi:MAG: TldD/PmbA family protein [Ignisphaera sp.]
MDVDWFRDVALKAVNYGVSFGAKFVDIRIEYTDSTYIEIENGVIQTARQGSELGASVRILYKGYWGFSSSSRLDPESLMKAVENAFTSARVASNEGSGDVDVVELPSLRDTYTDVVKVDLGSVGLETKVRDLLELHREIAKKQFMKYIGLRYLDNYIYKVYVSSDGRDILQKLAYTWGYIWATAREGDIVASVREEIGTRDGYTIWDKNPQNKLASKLIKRVENQLKAKPPKGGVFPVVLAPNVVGVFVHEAFGHLAEADLTMSGSAIRNKLGAAIASKNVTIVDDPAIEGGFGTYRYDDEGAEARRTILIDHGTVRELMVNREYSKSLEEEPTGNARAESYRVPPLIRMRNTFMVPGDYSVEELFEDIDYGYYLVSFRGGQANLDGTFQVGIQEAYEIVNGEIRNPIRNVSISGNTLETLALVDAVAKDFELEYGRCGKGQTIFVSDGGPHIRVKKVVIGGWGI